MHLARSKTDQTGHGTTLGIAAPTGLGDHDEQTVGERALLDAGAVWARWRDRLGAHGVLHGPVWRGIDRYGPRPARPGCTATPSPKSSNGAPAGRLDDAPLWGGHSLRRGFATEATAAGVPERDVQRHGRWRSRASVDVYIDAVTTFDATNPTRWLT